LAADTVYIKKDKGNQSFYLGTCVHSSELIEVELFQIETAEIVWMFDSIAQKYGHSGQWVISTRNFLSQCCFAEKNLK
jgi:hypothetical protein